MNIFFDLEETLILSWTDHYLCNRNKIIEFLDFYDIKEIHIFSFAIWNDDDKQHFNTEIKPFIEDNYKVCILSAPSVQEMRHSDTELTGIHYDSITDYISIRGKVGAFENWVQAAVGLKRNHNILIDDVVPNKTITNRTVGYKIDYINVFDDLRVD